MILRVLKSEYTSAQIDEMIKKYEVVQDTGKILSVAGTFDELRLLMSGNSMFNDSYRADFDGWLDENEKQQFTNELIATTRKTILNNLLLIASKGVWTEEARELYNYLNK